MYFTIAAILTIMYYGGLVAWDKSKKRQYRLKQVVDRAIGKTQVKDVADENQQICKEEIMPPDLLGKRVNVIDQNINNAEKLQMENNPKQPGGNDVFQQSKKESLSVEQITEEQKNPVELTALADKKKAVFDENRSSEKEACEVTQNNFISELLEDETLEEDMELLAQEVVQPQSSEMNKEELSETSGKGIKRQRL